MTARRLLTGTAVSVVAVAAVTGAVYAFRLSVPILSLGVLYLLAVLPVAVVWGRAFAIAVAIVSMLTFNFLFLPPRHTFTLLDRRDWLALAVNLVVAVVVSDLASRSRRRAADAERALASLLAVTAESERLEQEALAAERLRLSDSVKTAILRAVGHDLRSPLTAIRVAAESLASPSVTLSEEDRARQLDTVQRESARLDRLVANLLDLSRLQTGNAAPRRELVSMDELVGRAQDEIGGDERVRTDLPAASPLVEVDPVQVERVLVNLLENALRYSPTDSQVLVRVESEGDEALIRVVDRGNGVPEDELDRIFEPFQQLASGDRHRGTGLGLAIVRGFTEANGGRVWVESQPGAGASFAVAFPLVPALVEVER